MTTSTHDTEEIARELRQEVRRTQQLAREAVDALDVGAGIAHLRSLRSLLWRAGTLKIDLTDPATFDETPEE